MGAAAANLEIFVIGIQTGLMVVLLGLGVAGFGVIYKPLSLLKEAQFTWLGHSLLYSIPPLLIWRTRSSQVS